MYGNQNAKVSCSYKQFFEEAMNLVPNLRFIPQSEVPLDEIVHEAAIQSLIKDIPAPLTKEVLVTLRKYGEVWFKS